MQDSPTMNLPERPRLVPGVRLQHDKTRSMWVLLAPERVIETEGPAADILRLCDGRHTVPEIIDELAAMYQGQRQEIAGDVSDILRDLAARRLISA